CRRRLVERRVILPRRATLVSAAGAGDRRGRLEARGRRVDPEAVRVSRPVAEPAGTGRAVRALPAFLRPGGRAVRDRGLLVPAAGLASGFRLRHLLPVAVPHLL